MEITAQSQVDYRAYTGVAPGSSSAAVQEEEKQFIELPLVDKSSETSQKDAGDSNGEQAVQLSSNTDVRAYLSTLGSPQGESSQASGGEDKGEIAANDKGSSSSGEVTGSSELTPEEEQQVAELKARDQEVRLHEQAHLASAGSYAAGGAQFQYQTGPDGKQYAIGGHVNIDTSKESTPEATIAKAQLIQRAALAPADPSPQDVKIAAQAYRMMAEAQREIAQERASGEEASSNTAVVTGVRDAFGRLEDMGQALNSESF